MHGQTQSTPSQQHYVTLRNWCIALAITAAGVLVSYLWLDQPIAFFVQQNITDKTIFVWLQRLFLAFLLLSFLILLWCGLWTLMDRTFSHAQSIALACSTSFIAANFITNQLKYAFGRTWPNTWIENNPSLIQNGIYGFNPFHGGPGFASFPSGHVAAVCAVVTVLWSPYPILRPICVACAAAIAIGLIGANYHFLSDILGGIFVGISIGYITKKILNEKLLSESNSFVR
jgi:membrane-associated phospholipid phosphatase